MDIVARARNLLVSPRTEWPVIAAEATSVEAIYRDYVVYVAAIPAIAAFIGLTLFDSFGFFSTLLWAACHYVASLAIVYAVARVIDRLASSFDGTRDFLNAFKLAAYSMTAAWLAGVFSLVPPLAFLLLLGLYSIYLLYAGLPVLMKSPADKAPIYTLAVIAAGIVIQAIVAGILSRLFL